MTTLQERAPNRLLDLADLEYPGFHRILEEMEHIVSLYPHLYLHPSKRWEYPWSVQEADLTETQTVLDLGCGDSVFPLYLSKNCGEVTAADWNAPRALKASASENLHFVSADMSSLPFLSESFDKVFCISAIEHLRRDQIAATLREIHRVLRIGGDCLLTTDYYEDADAQLKYSGPGEPFPVDWFFFDEAQLRKHLLHVPGFELQGSLDLSVNWEKTRHRMQRFHGYPYTSVGLHFRKI